MARMVRRAMRIRKPEESRDDGWVRGGLSLFVKMHGDEFRGQLFVRRSMGRRWCAIDYSRAPTCEFINKHQRVVFQA